MKKPHERYTKDQSLEDLYAQAKSAQQKIQQMATEEQDEEKIIRILGLNDFINGVVGNFDKFKNGEAIDASVVIGENTPSEKNNTDVPPVSLIDFDVPSSGHKTISNGGSGTGNLLDDIADLNFTSISLPMNPVPSLPTPSNGGGSILDGLLAVNRGMSS